MIWDEDFMSSFGADKYILMKTYLGTNTILQEPIKIHACLKNVKFCNVKFELFEDLNI